MIYLKTFENLKKGDYLNLKKGDYLIVKTDDGRIDNEVVIITAGPVKKRKHFKSFAVELPDYVGEYLIDDHEIVKKITPEEAKILISANKYNL